MGVIHQNFHHKNTRNNIRLKFQFHHPKEMGAKKVKWLKSNLHPPLTVLLLELIQIRLQHTIVLRRWGHVYLLGLVWFQIWVLVGQGWGQTLQKFKITYGCDTSHFSS
jgi:hypothetical protein